MSENILEEQLEEIYSDKDMPQHIKEAKLDMLVRLGVDVNIEVEYTPFLIKAIEDGYTDLACLLLDNGADPNVSYKYHNPLFYAAFYKNEKVVKKIIEKGVDVNYSDYKIAPVLSLIAQQGDVEALKILIENGADVNILDDGWSPLGRAINAGNVENVRYLLEQGGDVNAKGYDGDNLLYKAVDKWHDIEIIEMLIDYGAALEAKERPSNTALMLASDKGRKDIVELLIKKGADVNCANAFGESALISAMKAPIVTDCIEIVELLTSNGADVNKKNIQGYTPLMEASHYGISKIVELLIKKGANVNDRSNIGFTALMGATVEGSESIVELLIQNGADVNMQDKEGETALMIAARKDYINVVKVLVKNGANLDLQDSDGKTALMKAVQSYSQDNIEALIDLFIENGANLDLKDKDGKTVLDYADKKIKSAINWSLNKKKWNSFKRGFGLGD